MGWGATATAAAHTCQVPLQPCGHSGHPVPRQALQTPEGLAPNQALLLVGLSQKKRGPRRQRLEGVGSGQRWVLLAHGLWIPPGAGRSVPSPALLPGPMVPSAGESRAEPGAQKRRLLSLSQASTCSNPPVNLPGPQ